MSNFLCKSEECTGCGACKNICPNGAIRMVTDANGFLHPTIDEYKCVDCGICEKTCPVNYPQYRNQSPICYAAQAHDEIRKISSSGGIFTLLAEKVLDKNGVVFGAAWMQDWSVAHIEIHNKDGLAKLRGSKYLQSDTRDSYIKVAEYLNEKRKVLFSGCPCQVAGLIAYLNTRKVPSDDLLTVEVICHGAPSYKLFRTYLEETQSFDSIADINFRDKKYGWTTSTNIRKKDGSIFHGSDSEDTYLKAFLPCMSMRNSCATCPFSKLPRQADISLGDYWGVERFDETLVDKYGTSIVLLNNQKGQLVYEQVKSLLSRNEKTPLDYATYINKTILHPFRQHAGHNHLYRSLGKKSIDKLVENALTGRYDIGIVGLWYGLNYGSILTYYALYQVINEFGYDPVFVPRPKMLWSQEFDDPNTIAQSFIRKHCSILPDFTTNHGQVTANDVCQDFIVGSDVVWNYKICGEMSDAFFFLDWVEDGHRKIAYAASWGINNPIGNRAYWRKSKFYLQKFHSISQREEAGIHILRDYGINDAEQVLDPVFLIDKSVYDQLIYDTKQLKNAPFVFVYLLRHDYCDERKQLFSDIAELLRLDTVFCVNPMTAEEMREKYGDIFEEELPVEHWIWYIKHCEIVIADSFHALCFALIYHKRFIVIYEEMPSVENDMRFKSLLDIVGLKNRLIEDVRDYSLISTLIDEPIDWDAVDMRLSSLRASSRYWLANSLNRPIVESWKNQDIRLLSEKNREILDLETEIDRLKEENAMLWSRKTALSSRIFSVYSRGMHALRTRGLKYTLGRFETKVKQKLKKEEHDT